MRAPGFVHQLGWSLVPIFFAPLILTPATQSRLIHLKAFSASTLWVWGVRADDFVVYRSADAGATWRACEPPQSALRDTRLAIRSSHELIGIDVTPTGRDSVRLDWRAIGHYQYFFYAVAINSTSTTDGCKHWSIQEGRINASRGKSLSDVQLPFDYIQEQWLAGGKRGFALLTGNCCSSGQQRTAMLRTKDGGRNWTFCGSDHGAGPLPYSQA